MTNGIPGAARLAVAGPTALWFAELLPTAAQSAEHRTADAAQVEQFKTTGVCVGCVLPKIQMDRWTLQYADLHQADLWRTGFEGADLNSANLNAVTADQSVFNFGNLTGANLSGGTFVESGFAYATMTNANLSGASLREG